MVARAKLSGRARRLIRVVASAPTLLFGCALATVVIFIGCLGPSPSTPTALPALIPLRPPQPSTMDTNIRVRLTGASGVDYFTLAVKNSYVLEDAGTGRILEDSPHAAGR